MKKRKIIIPVSIVSIFSVATAVLYFLAKDDTAYPYEQGFSLKNEKVYQKHLVDSFDTSKEKKINFSFTKDDLNNLFYNSFHNLKDNGGSSKNVNEFHVEINGNNYRFIFTTKMLMLKTRIIMDTTLEEKEDSFVFNINSIKNGQLPTKWILESTGALNKLALEDIFKASGLSIQVDYSNNQFVYSKENFSKDFLTYIKKNTGELFQGVLNNSLTSLAIKDGISYSFDLSNLEENKELSDSDPTSLHYKNYDLVELNIKHGAEHISEMYRNGLTDELIDGYRNSVWPESLKDAPYVGTGVDHEIKDRIKKTDVNEYIFGPYDKQIATLKESELDSLLGTTSIVGKNYLIHYKDKVAYALIDRFYSDMYTTSEGAFLNFTLGININGLETRAIIETKANYVDNSYIADFRIQNVYYGKTIADKDFATLVKNLVAEGFASLYEHDWISFTGKDNSMLINFDRLLATSDELEEYNLVFDKTLGKRYFKIEANPVNENGSFSLYYQKY